MGIEFNPSGGSWDVGHPYAWRLWLRGRLPWFLIRLGIADKGEDCGSVGARHLWYNRDKQTSGCYHCKVVQPGQLWKQREQE